MLKKIKSDILASIKNKRINVFFLFLLLAFIILIFTKLSKEYTNTITFAIEKTNVPPENIILNNKTPLNITLKTHGFKWLNYYISKPKIKIDFGKDVYKKDSVFIWHKSKVYLENTQFNKNVQLLNISPDTLFFNFSANMVKKVPVKLDANIQFSQGYDVSKSYVLQPDSIVVIGPKKVVSNIDFIETSKFNLKEVRSDISESVKLKFPKNSPDLTYSTNAITLKATVEKFTEGTLKIPVTMLNVPNNIKLKYFPKEVNVSYYVSLNDFKSVLAKDFKVVSDFNKATSEQSFIVPEIETFPKVVKHVKINQQHIEFIIIE
ncbi:CdaR family protein [Mariniflexile sp.]|uniref:CdaR family protein n=1 Tax=Mariniflexile sp. TaxID=1979402 RepID=UPI004047E325